MPPSSRNAAGSYQLERVVAVPGPHPPPGHREHHAHEDVAAEDEENHEGQSEGVEPFEMKHLVSHRRRGVGLVAGGRESSTQDSSLSLFRCSLWGFGL